MTAKNVLSFVLFLSFTAFPCAAADFEEKNPLFGPLPVYTIPVQGDNWALPGDDPSRTYGARYFRQQASDPLLWAGYSFPSESSTAGFYIGGLAYRAGGYLGVGVNVDPVGGAVAKSKSGVSGWDVLPSEKGLKRADYRVAAGPGGYVRIAVRDAWFSANGTTWDKIRLPASADVLTDVIYGGGRFLIVGEAGFVATSINGSSWVARTLPGRPLLRRAAYGLGKWIAVGDAGAVAVSGTGVSWSVSNVGFKDFNFVAASGKRVIVAGEKKAFYGTADLKEWDDLTEVADGHCSNLYYARSRFVAVINPGRAPRLLDDLQTVLTSSNGLDWEEEVESTLGRRLSQIVCADGKYVGIGAYYDFRGDIAFSTDGIHWKYQTLLALESGQGLNGVAWLNGRFVAWGYNGFVASSTDGETWQVHHTASEEPSPGVNTSRIVWNGSVYAAARGDGTFATSPDLVTWQEASVRPWGNKPLLDAAWFNGRFVVCGRKVLAVSADGMNWEQVEGGDAFSFFVLLALNGKLRAYGPGADSLWTADGVDWNYQSTNLALGSMDFEEGRGRIQSLAYGDVTLLWPYESDVTRTTFFYTKNGVTWWPGKPSYGLGFVRSGAKLFNHGGNFRQEMTLAVPKFSGVSVLRGTQGAAFRQEVGLRGTYVSLRPVGSLPPGVRLSGTALAGRPSKAGSFEFILRVSTHLKSADKKFVLVVAKASARN